LTVGLGSSRNDVSWVNIWQDPDAAAHVRTLRDGNETVPTAVTGAGDMLINERLLSDAPTIKAHLSARGA
jgi:hypothetical protein